VRSLPLPSARDQTMEEFGELTMVEGQMRSAWLKVLPTEIAGHHGVDVSSDFFAVGGTSMLLVKPRAEIERTFNVAIPMVQLFEKSTLRGMASRIDPIQTPDMTAAIDWINETKLNFDETIMLNPSPGAEQVMTPPKVIILTGSTGFLGRALLRHLIDIPTVSKIHCIAFRSKPTRSLPETFASPKVTIRGGDLLLPRLGLSDSSIKEIFSRADAIIHNAADVSFMKSYSSLRRVNVVATKDLAPLALPRKIPFHYISSARVAHLAKRSSFGEEPVTEYEPPTDGSDGYTASKWASEVYLERVNKATDLPVWIHRPSSIMGDEAADTDVMANLLKYSMMMRAVPIMEGSSSDIESYIDFVDVETVAHGVLEILEGEKVKRSEDGGAKFFYHSGEMVIPMTSLGGAGQAEKSDGVALGEGFETLPLGEWAERAKGLGMNELVVTFLNTALDGQRAGNTAGPGGGIEGLVLFPKLVKSTTGVV
jgi:hybrid polyketide synthase / nonribosomal peptide synthetase ACE1